MAGYELELTGSELCKVADLMLHGATTRKTAIYIHIVVKVSNPTL